jgi:hypothetical protein
MTTADTQIIAEGGMSSIRCVHPLARPITLDFARRVTGRAEHAIAFVCDILAVQFNRGCRSLDGPISCRPVAIQDQISLHSLSHWFSQCYWTRNDRVTRMTVLPVARSGFGKAGINGKPRKSIFLHPACGCQRDLFVGRNPLNCRDCVKEHYSMQIDLRHRRLVDPVENLVREVLVS